MAIDTGNHHQVIDEDELQNIKAAVLLSNVIGGLEMIRTGEPAKHTFRYKEVTKVIKEVVKLLDHFPSSWSHDLVDLGNRVFDNIDEKLVAAIEDGIKARREGFPTEQAVKMRRQLEETIDAMATNALSGILSPGNAFPDPLPKPAGVLKFKEMS